MWRIVAAVCLFCTFGLAEIRSITQDDNASTQKRAFLQKLMDERPTYVDYSPAWKEITSFSNVVYEPQRIVTRDGKSPLFVRVYRIGGDDYSGLPSDFACEQNLCPLVFELRTYSGSTGEREEFRNSDKMRGDAEWIVLELLSERSGILHFMDRGQKVRVRKTEQGLHIDLHPVFRANVSSAAIASAAGTGTTSFTTRKENGLTITVADGAAPFEGERNEATPTFIAANYYPTHFAPQVSFDCTKATLESEQTICQKPELGDLDLRIAAYYDGIVPFYPPLKIKQIAWLRKRDACEVSEECLQNIMQKRVDELAELFSQLVNERVIR